LNEAGINTGRYFTVDLPNGLSPNAKIHIMIDENGQPMIVNKKENDPILEQILEDGYVRNTRLHRRFVMAQMFHALNFRSYDGKYKGYNDYIKYRYAYDYTFKTMLDELKVLSKLEVRDKESFEERSHFFTKEVVIAVLEDYMDKLKAYIDKLPEHKCKGVPYKKVKGKNIFNVDLQKKIYSPLENRIRYIRYAKAYATMYLELQNFMSAMIKLPWNTAKSTVWFDTFKGEGAYYTLKNLVMFHGCEITADNGINYGVNSIAYLKSRLDAYQREGWRMFALMKKVIADNNFDFKARMEEIYSK